MLNGKKSQFICKTSELRTNLHGQALEVQNGSLQWARIHTIIGLNDRQFFEKLILVKHFWIICAFIRHILLIFHLKGP